MDQFCLIGCLPPSKCITAGGKNHLTWANGVIFVYQKCDITIVVVPICVLWWFA